jgi:hypothetical protein
MGDQMDFLVGTGAVLPARHRDAHEPDFLAAAAGSDERERDLLGAQGAAIARMVLRQGLVVATFGVVDRPRAVALRNEGFLHPVVRGGRRRIQWPSPRQPASVPGMPLSGSGQAADGRERFS